MKKIGVAICGCASIGKEVEKAISTTKDMELVGIITRRDTKIVRTESDVPVISVDEALSNSMWKCNIDVITVCGGYEKNEVLRFASCYNVFDCFNAQGIEQSYFKVVGETARRNKKASVVSFGWDKGTSDEQTDVGLILTAYARATYLMSYDCQYGAKRVYEVDSAMLSSLTQEQQLMLI